jgi:hypothetical protein
LPTACVTNARIDGWLPPQVQLVRHPPACPALQVICPSCGLTDRDTDQAGRCWKLEQLLHWNGLRLTVIFVAWSVADKTSPMNPRRQIPQAFCRNALGGPNSTVQTIIPLSYEVTFVIILPRATNAHCTYSLGVAPWLASKVSLLRANKL